jgi:hypothetical protein
VYFAIGYKAGAYTTGLPNIRNTIYQFNNFDFPNFDKKFKFRNIPHGLDLELGLSRNKFFYFLNLSSMRIVSHGSGMESSISSEKIDVKIKMRLNQFGFLNFGYHVNEHFDVALSIVDIGSFKILYKSNVDPKIAHGNKTFTANKWSDLYDVNKGALSSYTCYGSTVYLTYNATKNIRFRLAYYRDWFGENMTGFRYMASNVNATLSYRFNKK